MNIIHIDWTEYSEKLRSKFSKWLSDRLETNWSPLVDLYQTDGFYFKFDYSCTWNQFAKILRYQAIPVSETCFYEKS